MWPGAVSHTEPHCQPRLSSLHYQVSIPANSMFKKMQLYQRVVGKAVATSEPRMKIEAGQMMMMSMIVNGNTMLRIRTSVYGPNLFLYDVKR